MAVAQNQGENSRRTESRRTESRRNQSRKTETRSTGSRSIETPRTGSGRIKTRRTESLRTSKNTNSHLNKKEKPKPVKVLSGFRKFAVEKQVEQLISRPYSFSYLLPDFGHLSAVNEYCRLLNYVEKCLQPDKKQLTPILFPVFVHLYLLLLQNYANDEEGFENADAFFKKYYEVFLKAKGYEPILKDLNKLKNKKDVKKHEYFSKFWRMKYVINASIDVLQNLRKFLENIRSETVLYVLHFHIYFQNKDFSLSVDKKQPKRDVTVNNSQNPSGKTNAKGILLPSHVLPTVVKYKLSYFCSADFNEKESEICIASHNSTLGIESEMRSFIQIECMDKNSRTVKAIKLPGVSAVKYLPRENNVILASYGMNVKLISTTTGKDIFKYDTNHLAKIWNVDVSHSNPLFATASKDSMVCVWNLNDRMAVKQYGGHKGEVSVVKFHPSGMYFATGSTDASVLLWAMDRSLPIRCFTTHKGRIISLAFSPDGKLIATSDSLGVIKLWDIRQNTKVSEVPKVKAQASNICFNDINTHIGYCDDKGKFGLWDYRNANEIISRNYRHVTPMVMKFNKKRQWRIAFKKVIQKR